MGENNSTSSALWALVAILLVALVVVVIYFSGIFSQKKTIEININKPGMVLLLK